MSMKFRRNGRNMSAEQFFKEIGDEAIKRAEDRIESSLKQTTDPTTGSSLEVTRLHENGKTVFSVSGSPEAVEEAKRNLKGDEK